MATADPTTSDTIDGRQRLVAVLFADMVEYSRRLEEDEKLNAPQAARAISLFRSLIADYGGEIANVAGDGILALFESADRALRFAIQIQAEFRDQSVWGNGEPIQFRVALNIGEVVLRDGNFQGHCVNIASRLQALADPNGILVTAAVRAAVRPLPGVAMRPMGPRRLKNIVEPVEIFEVQADAARLLPAVPVRAPPLFHEPARTPTVAVLPFSNLSGDPRNQHLCEGIAEDIIFNLTRFRDLMVIARYSAFSFADKSTPAVEIGARLGVRYILSGSLRRNERRLRIAVELTDASLESVLWSDRFNLELEDLFDLQDEIAASVATRLSVQIEMAERRRESPHPRDLRAYGLVARGQNLMMHFTQEGNAHARRLFEEAISLAPDYSRAHSAVSRTLNLDWRYSWSGTPAESLAAAVASASRATQLDGLDARGFAELANARLYSRRLDESLALYVHALELNPNDSDIIAEYADALVYDGKPQKSVELLEKAMRLNPFYPDWYLWYLADAYDSLGRYADVVSTIQRMRNPAEGRRLLAIAYAHLGMETEARAEAAEVLRLHPTFRISHWRRVPPFQPGEALERYLDGLRKAGLPE